MEQPYGPMASWAGYWRVDGIGPVMPGMPLGARSVVLFSEISRTRLDSPYQSQSLTGKHKKLSVHAASLSLFMVGSLWYEGKRISRATGINNSYSVDIAKAKFVTLSESLFLNQEYVPTVVPEKYFCMGENRKDLSSSLYALLPVKNNDRTKWLVIPCYELMRFYTSGDSRLMSSVMQGKLDEYIFWEKCRMEGDAAILRVDPNHNWGRSAIAVLARAVAKPRAKRSLLGVHKNFSRISINNKLVPVEHQQELTIRCEFPFSDATRLSVVGKRMPLANGSGDLQWAVFVMEIFRCSHNFDFDEIVVECSRGTPGSQGEDGIRPPSHRPAFPEGEGVQHLQDTPADARMDRLATRSYHHAFSGLENVRFKRRYVAEYEYNSRARGNIDVPIEGMSLEDGNYTEEGKGVLGVDKVQEPIKNINRKLSLFLEMLKHLRNLSSDLGWNIQTYLHPGGFIKDGEYISIFPEVAGKRRSWHLIEDPDIGLRPRQVIFVEIRASENCYFYILEMEIKKTSGQCTIALHGRNYQRLIKEDFETWLRLTVINNRWPTPSVKWRRKAEQKSADDLFSYVVHHRIDHPSSAQLQGADASKAWSVSVLAKLRELLPEFFI